MVDPTDPGLPWRSIDRYLARHGMPLPEQPPYPATPQHPDPWWATTGGVHAANSIHPSGRARDYSANHGCEPETAAALLMPLAVGNTEGGVIWLHQLFYTPLDLFIQDGQRVPEDKIAAQNLRAIHQTHIHVALPVGVTLDDLF